MTETSAFGNIQHAPEPFIPEEVWSACLENTLRRYEMFFERVMGPKEQRRRGHVKATPYTETELAERAGAVEAWQALTDDLEAKGYLEHDHCYECGGALIPATSTEHREWVYDETEDEWHTRIGRTE